MADLRGVTVVAGGRLYALPFDWLTEVVEDPELRPAAAGGDAAALARVRGRWVPVVPLGSPAPRAGAGTPHGALLVVVGGRTARLGVLADELRGLIERTGSARSGEGRGEPASPVTNSPDGVVTWIDPVDLVGGRAELLSERGDVMDSATTTSPITHVVEFRLGDDAFGINVAKVFEVIRYPAVRPLPHTPPFLEGAAELRGAVLPVIDLRKRFGVEPRPRGPETRVIVTELGGERIGLVVDRVLGVVRLSADEVRPAPKFFKGLAARYLEGMVSREGRNVIVLNTDEILTSKEKIQLRGAGRSGTGTPPPETDEDSG